MNAPPLHAALARTPIGSIRATSTNVVVLGSIVALRSLRYFTRKRPRRTPATAPASRLGPLRGAVTSLVIRDGTGDILVEAWDAAAEAVAAVAAAATADATTAGLVACLAVENPEVKPRDASSSHGPRTTSAFKLVLSSATGQGVVPVSAGDVLAATSASTLSYLPDHVAGVGSGALTALAAAPRKVDLAVVRVVARESTTRGKLKLVLVDAGGARAALYVPDDVAAFVAPEITSGSLVALHGAKMLPDSGAGASLPALTLPFGGSVTLLPSFEAPDELDAHFDAAVAVHARKTRAARLRQTSTLRALLSDAPGSHNELRETTIAELSRSSFALGSDAPIGVLRGVRVLDFGLPFAARDRSRAFYTACPQCSRAMRPICPSGHVLEPGTTGQPCWRVEMRLLDETGVTAPITVFGEVAQTLLGSLTHAAYATLSDDAVLVLLHSSILWATVDAAFELSASTGELRLLALRRA
ncbi:uncharacterized protein AMSG_00773 [Thecamonas trahens ATCC 50062]|uniref:Uncharacterized protein n=1 Tax=Thecamonas trahens ATCC 50062 TaxID=461836 RepID=A0A0L0DE66_THETB|nr:hypothetical protein AMSG_00773 [Thecamonas trahens ATCC 50062]KNC50612.1 hypothetical protein AMSG_00773 [Thecamonas trahens ATCC 50062]|eukprot:XP_013762499.1 hypothetical protein AMSG_00773 [Thecamonas trahens ATCC 50062]